MRILFLISILVFSFVLVTANPRNDSLTYPIKQIKFDYSFRTDSSAIDTNIFNLHIINPVFFSEPSNTYLSTSGYPIESNYIISRLKTTDIFFPAVSLLPFVSDTRQNIFYDTKRQFTSLTYKNQGGTQTVNEEYFQVTHTQNLSKKTNIGLLFDILSSYSRYNYIEASDFALKSFYRYSGDNFLTYNQIYYNSLKIRENGGVSEDSLINYETDNFMGIRVNLNNANSRLKRLGFNSINEFKLKRLFNKDDTTGKDLGSLFYNLNIEKSKRDYSDQVEDTFFYRNFYNGLSESSDSIVLTKISNKFSLSSPNLSKYLPNLRLSLANDLFYLKNGIPEDTLMYQDSVRYYNKNRSSEFSTYASLDISQEFRQVKWKATWDTYILGYNLGDQKLKLQAITYIDKKKSLGLILEGSQESRTASFLLNRYFSNHFIWFNSFKRENIQNLSATIFINKPALSIKGDYSAVSNYVYFDTNSLPVQANNTMHIASLKFDNNINLWKINFQNSVIYQKNSSKAYIHVPEFALYNSTSFVHTFHFFTGGKLFFRFGLDFYYTSSFNPDAYNPNVGVFYLQNSVEAGNYPKLDLHLTIKVKTVSLFVKYSHINSGLSGPREFNAMHYPMLPATLSYGVNWLFYD